MARGVARVRDAVKEFYIVLEGGPDDEFIDNPIDYVVEDIQYHLGGTMITKNKWVTNEVRLIAERVNSRGVKAAVLTSYYNGIMGIFLAGAPTKKEEAAFKRMMKGYPNRLTLVGTASNGEQFFRKVGGGTVTSKEGDLGF